MAGKKDLAGAIRGADLFFSANDEPQVAQEAQEVQEARKPRKAQEVPQAQLASMVQEMQEHIEAQEAYRTQGRKGLKMPRVNVSITPSNMDYLKTMAAIQGIAITRYINRIIEQHAAANAERYQRAKEIVRDE